MDDLISRQAAIDALRMDIDIIPYAKAREYARAVIETVYNRLENLSTAQPENKTGHWENVDIKMDWGNLFPVKCSECGARHLAGYDFCPSCGADMTEGEE